MTYKDPEKRRAHLRAYMRAYRESHRDKLRPYMRAYYLAHKENYRAHDRSYRFTRKAAVLTAYNPTGRLSCATCGEPRIGALTLSHLGPTPAFPRCGHKLYSALRKANCPPLPLLTECMNCNVTRDNWGNG